MRAPATRQLADKTHQWYGVVVFRYVGLIAEEAEDMWHIYNLIRVGDTVKCSTIRKVSFF